jgi:hypothetical protein
MTIAGWTPSGAPTSTHKPAVQPGKVNSHIVARSAFKTFDPGMFVEIVLCFWFASSTLRGSAPRQ